MRGHVEPAAAVATLSDADRHLGVPLPDGTRLCRCLRCDMWLDSADPGADATHPTMPPLAELPRPRRGKILQDAILLRLIAINRAAHCIAFALLAVVLAVVELKLPAMQHSATVVRDSLQSTIGQSGQDPSRRFLTHATSRVLDFDRHTVVVLMVSAVLYSIIEGVEAVGLWRERRWAEYLTALATAGFLPLEVHELIDRVTALRIGALVVNIAILVWLVWNKHLFGLQGGHATLVESTDWPAIIATPTPARGKLAVAVQRPV
jgi:uncharacterized membrane protein (DUF2068 family)